MITENFDEANMISDNTELKKFIKKYLLGSKYTTKESVFVREWFEHFVGGSRQMEILGVIGSAMEGGVFSVFNFNSSGDYEFDFDLMVGFGPQPLSHNQQKIAFKHLQDYPAHLIIEIPHLKNWDIDFKYFYNKNGTNYISALKVKEDFTLLNKSGMPENVHVYTDSDPVQASVSINIEINSTDILSMGPLWKELYDGMLNISDRNEQDQRKLNKTWQDINFDRLFKKLIGHIDLVPSIQCDSWPVIAEEWKTRRRLWPQRSLIKKIIEGGHHVVAKASPGGDPNLEWRLSFSKAELTLAEHRTHVQKKCYYIFKTIFKEYLGKSGVTSTYYLKTIMMWAMEQNPPEYWREDNIGQAVLGLLDDLYQALVTGNLPHYFIPKNNLLRHISCDVLEQEAADMFHLRETIVNINRNEPILLSSKAKGTEYETLMLVSGKTFKAYHAKYIEFLSNKGVSCSMEYFESVFSRIDDFKLIIVNGHCRDNFKIITKESRKRLLQCFYFPKLENLKEYLTELYINHTGLVEKQIKEAKKEIENNLERLVGITCQFVLLQEENINKLKSSSSSLFLNQSIFNSIEKLKKHFNESSGEFKKINKLISIALKPRFLVINRTLLKNLQHLKAEVYHTLTQMQEIMINMLELSNELEELHYKIMKVNDQAIDAVKQVMYDDPPLVDKLYQSSIRATAMAMVKTSLTYLIADNIGSLIPDMMSPDVTKMMNKFNEFKENTSKLFYILKNKVNEAMVKEEERNTTFYNLNFYEYFGDVEDVSAGFIGLVFWFILSNSCQFRKPFTFNHEYVFQLASICNILQ